MIEAAKRFVPDITVHRTKASEIDTLTGALGVLSRLGELMAFVIEAQRLVKRLPADNPERRLRLVLCRDP